MPTSCSRWQRHLPVSWNNINHHPIILLKLLRRPELLLATATGEWPTRYAYSGNIVGRNWRPGPWHKQRVGSFNASSLIWHGPDHRFNRAIDMVRLMLIRRATTSSIVDEAICNGFLQSFIFHFCGHIQLLAVRRQTVCASGFSARALRYGN